MGQSCDSVDSSLLQPQVDEQERIAKVLASMDAKILDEEEYWDKLQSVKFGLMTNPHRQYPHTGRPDFQHICLIFQIR